ncbi:succinate dehydrogenase assembly factor 2 [Roseibacterium sp. SDUM158016]|jgi:antitoxin CptB|uniref:succinate dehydrogenase assembly factor 2 n=1 Tax=Roseicyclus sediminis TaxID=2980997 RepID=UPI0021CEF50F|nr:succinate dehydrogenase assembly factor 2 [Roseibacterium sp. SDUM158016]MCU4655140.1 succinate dehydrogenase assembly factor 2 [Roseibacterium sp. SDUM158016]
MTETREIRLKRLRMRAWHRGIKEMDLILGGWADSHLEGADDATIEAFEAVLAEADQDLYSWVSGLADPPAALAPMLDRIAAEFRTARP